MPDKVDPRRDILLERTVAAPVEAVWAAWTVPEQLRQWFAPAPFALAACEVDLRPGGVFRTVMSTGQGADVPSLGCYLEVEEPRRLVWTTVLGPEYRPVSPPPRRPVTVVVTLMATERGTAYSVLARHGDPETRSRHLDQGYLQGWEVTLDQLEDQLGGRLGASATPTTEGTEDAQAR